MNTASAISKDGYLLSKTKYLPSYSPLSLRNALYSFFSTYQGMKFLFPGYLLYLDGKINENKWDYPHKYVQLYGQSIIHVHHFFELLCKDCLREIHPLLAADVQKEPIIIHKLIVGEKLDEEDLEEIKSMEFSESYSRVKTLLSNGRMPKEYLFLLENNEVLTSLNTLRNRLLHRGTFVLNYRANDIFWGKYLLPMIKMAIELPMIKNSQYFWQFKNCKIGISVINEMIVECKNQNPDLRKLALLKEIGRSSYDNPIEMDADNDFDKISNRDEEKRAKKFAESERSHFEISICPVCGVNSLVLYDTINEGIENDDGTFDHVYIYSFEVKCMCCGFNIDDNIGNLSKYGMSFPEIFKNVEL